MKKKKILSIIVFIIGLITLIVGVGFLVSKLIQTSAAQDEERLISVGSWVREDEPSVIWNFAEEGKGKLTTNDNQNSYDFIWKIENEKLKIETSWLYPIDNEYTYRIEQGNLVLLENENDNETIKFVPVDK